MTVHTAAKPLLDQLDEAGIEYELLPHRRTDTAVAEAEALGIEPSHAKTLVLATSAGFVLAVLPAPSGSRVRRARGRHARTVPSAQDRRPDRAQPRPRRRPRRRLSVS